MRAASLPREARKRGGLYRFTSANHIDGFVLNDDYAVSIMPGTVGILMHSHDSGVVEFDYAQFFVMGRVMWVRLSDAEEIA